MKYMDLPVLINEVFKGFKWLIGNSMLVKGCTGNQKRSMETRNCTVDAI